MENKSILISDGSPKFFSKTKINNKHNRVYKFCPYRITKIEPFGNNRRGFKCPKARSGHRIVADNASIYSFGGYNPNIEVDDEDLRGDVVWMNSCLLFKELWKFNIASQTWTKLKTQGIMPEELASHAAVLLEDNMLVFGGTGVPFGMSSSNSVHVCNLKTLDWTHIKTTGQPPLQQYGQAIAVHQKGLFVVGGTTGFEYSMSVHHLNLATKEWSELSTKLHPDPRYRHEIALEGKQLFVFGGGTATDSFGFKEIPVFNIENQIWKTLTTSEDYPAARRCHGCVQMNNDVYICGGHDGEMIFPDLWRINLKTLQWKKLNCTLPRPVYFHSAALSPVGQMFIFGGVTNIQQNTRTNELYSVWLKVASLKEMCWQAVMYYIPHIAQLRPQQLLEAGVPPTFLSRVEFFSGENSDDSPPDL